MNSEDYTANDSLLARNNRWTRKIKPKNSYHSWLNSNSGYDRVSWCKENLKRLNFGASKHAYDIIASNETGEILSKVFCFYSQKYNYLSKNVCSSLVT